MRTIVGDTLVKPRSRPDRDRNRVQSVQRAIRVLKAFDSNNNPTWSVTELAQHLRLPKTVVLRLLATLEDGGLIEQHPDSHAYSLGRGLYELAGSFARRNDLIRISTPYLRELVALTGFTAQSCVLDRTEALCLAAVESPMVMRAVFYPGLRRPAHATASGRVLLSGLSDDAVRTLYTGVELAPLTSQTITEIEGLVRNLEQVRRRGYAFNDGESIAGLRAASAPIRNSLGQIMAAVSLGWPSELTPEETKEQLIRAVVKTADQISQRLGGLPKSK